MHALLFVWEDVLWNINIIFLLTKTHTQLLPHGTTLKGGNRKQVFPKIELSDLANKQTRCPVQSDSDKWQILFSIFYATYGIYLYYLTFIWNSKEMDVF